MHALLSEIGEIGDISNVSKKSNLTFILVFCSLLILTLPSPSPLPLFPIHSLPSSY